MHPTAAKLELRGMSVVSGSIVRLSRSMNLVLGDTASRGHANAQFSGIHGGWSVDSRRPFLGSPERPTCQPIQALTGTAVSSSGWERISTRTGPSCSIACLKTLARSAGSATVKLFTPKASATFA